MDRSSCETRSVVPAVETTAAPVLDTLTTEESAELAALESLGDSEYALARDLAACREVLHVAVEQLHEVTCQRDRLRKDNRRLREPIRRDTQKMSWGPHSQLPEGASKPKNKAKLNTSI